MTEENKKVSDIGGYRALVETSGDRVTVTFLDFPNVSGCGSTKDEAVDDAFDALYAFFDIVDHG